MTVHLFGAISSPSCANVAPKNTAENNQEEFDKETMDTLERNFYDNDCLKAVESEEAGIELARNLFELLQRGGFHLTKWTSNSREVLKFLRESECAAAVKGHEERALGVEWDIISDKFGYKITLTLDSL